VARKTASSLEGQRREIKKRYKTHGARADKRIVGEDALSVVELATKKEAACFLKAADYPYNYIGEALHVTRGTVRRWFEDDAMRVRVAEIQQNFVDGAVKLLKTYALELVEMLVEIARSDVDPKVRIQAITEALDRMGLAKVNKSESAVTNKNEVEFTDKTGFLEQMREAPPEAQQAMASKLEELHALASEHTGRNVNG
jgi:hypothetical protein